MAQVLCTRIVEVERIDRMIASAEARRAATLREITHHREQFAAALRGAVRGAIADGEFAVVAAPDGCGCMRLAPEPGSTAAVRRGQPEVAP